MWTVDRSRAFLRGIGAIGAAVAALAAGGCDAPREPGDIEGPADIESGEGLSGGGEEAVAESAAGLQAAGACPGDRWIGRVPAGMACPAGSSPSWGKAPLFPGATGALARYCVYEWSGAGTPDPTKLPVDPANADGGITWLDKDCRVVAPMAPSATEVVRALASPAMIEGYFAALEMPYSVNYAAGGPTTRLAIVDSWPSTTEVGRSAHGFAMAGISRGTACAALTGGCPAEVRPYLALDVTAQGAIDRTHGGHFGYQGVVAARIFQAVREWQQDSAAATAPGPLVLNLSIAWDAIHNEDEESSFSEAATAVLDALKFARCAGALSFAAAGNESGGVSPSQGAMFPAAWESETVSCQGAAGQPPVYAVGATDATGGPLPNARPGSLPRLVADGYNVPVLAQIGGSWEPVGPYSGTSVATAAVSGAAALVWAMNPAFTASEVYNHLLAHGISTATVPDVCPAIGACGTVTRLSMCGATGAASCRALPASNAVVGPLVWGAAVTLTPAPGTGWASSATLPGTGCTGTVHVDPTKPLPTPMEACPVEKAPNESIVPWASAQPGVPVCGACMIEVNDPMVAILELGISEKILTPVTPTVLSLLDDRGVVTDRYDLTSQTPAGGLSGGTFTQYRLPSLQNIPFKYAVVEWLRTADIESQSDVAIAQP